MVNEERVEAVLDRVRPFPQAAGWDIDLVAVHGLGGRPGDGPSICAIRYSFGTLTRAS